MANRILVRTTLIGMLLLVLGFQVMKSVHKLELQDILMLYLVG